MPKKYKQEEIIEILNKYNIKLLSEYKNNTTKLKMICSCGNEFEKAFKIMNKSGKFKCNDCIKKEQIKNQTMPYELAKQKVEEKGYRLLTSKSEYVKASAKNKLQCPNGHVYEQILLDLFKGHECKKCATEKVMDKLRLDFNEVKNFIESKNLTLLSNDYKGVDIPLKVKCNICNDIFYPTFHNLKHGTGCPNCFNKNRGKSNIIPYEERLKYVKSFGYDILTPKEEYINGENKVKIKCSKGHIYEARLHDFYVGNRCPICKESKGERKIKMFLDENKIKYKQQYTFENCKSIRELPFDFYLPDCNLLIEYDGKQHYIISSFYGGIDSFVGTKVRDTIKNIYCENNNIKLLRIPYWEFNNIENIISNNLNMENFQRLSL